MNIITSIFFSPYRFIKGRINHYISRIKEKKRYENVLIFDPTCTINRNSFFEGQNKMYPYSYFNGKMGYGTYIGPYSRITGDIGKFTSIGPNVITNLGIHPNRPPYVTTCPMFFSTNKQNGATFATNNKFNEFSNPIRIGHDCWIGENVFIIGGVSIGNGAIVYAGSIVTKDIPPYAIVGGNPAKIIRYRFDKDTIQYLEKIKWWDMPIEWLRDNWDLFCDIDKLKEKINNA